MSRASSTMVPSNRLVGPPRVLIQRFMIVHCEHLWLLTFPLLGLRTCFCLIKRLILLSGFFVTTCLLLIFLIEKGKIIRIFTLTVARIVIRSLLLISI